MIKYVFGILVLIILCLGAYLFLSQDGQAPSAAATDPKNATYEIQDKSVTLVDGNSIVQDTPSSQTITAYFGNEAKGDFDGDGDEDVAFILIQNGGGSGTFVYAVAALKDGDGYRGTNGILLGDRISPQTTEFKDGVILVNYADRRADEPMSALPSVGVTRRLKVEGDHLVVLE